MRLFIAHIMALFAFAAAVPREASVHKLKESIAVPHGWTKQGRARPNDTIELHIALPQPNFPLLEQNLYEVSDPYHERYGQHLTQTEVHELIAPHDESVELVDDWLASYDIFDGDFERSPARDWVKLKIPIRSAERLLDTEYFIWTHENGESIVRTTKYSVPAHLDKHIDLVQPTTLFSNFRAMRTTFKVDKTAPPPVSTNAPPIKVPSASSGKVDASCSTTITIKCLFQLYNAVGYVPSADIGNRIGVTGYLEQFANNVDLQLFFKDQVPAAVGSSFTFISVAGGIDNQSLPGIEADLDTEFAYGMSYPIPAVFYSTAGRPPFIPDTIVADNTNEPYLDWLDFVLTQSDLPQVISYDDDEQTVPVSYAQRVCQGLAQLGARGITLTFSSGDGGVGDQNPDPATQRCFSNDGRNTTRFLPLFPSTCPFVTSVGGTTSIPEVAANISGGGFSNVFSRPAYQELAVSQYLKKLPKGTFAGLFNPNGRAIPDISAQADMFRIFFQGNATLIGGTSAATPTVAGLVALLNDARLKKKLPPLGFLNPLIYALAAVFPKAFNDITIGNNPGCGTRGFNATKGWDPVTGVGTPNFGVLKDIITVDTLGIVGL